MNFTNLYLETILLSPRSFIFPFFANVIWWGPVLVTFLIVRKFKMKFLYKILITFIPAIITICFSGTDFYKGEYDGEMFANYAYKKLQRVPSEKRRDTIEYKYMFLKLTDCDWEARLDNLKLADIIDEKTLVQDLYDKYKEEKHEGKKAVIVNQILKVSNIVDYLKDNHRISVFVSYENLCVNPKKQKHEKLIIETVEKYVHGEINIP